MMGTSCLAMRWLAARMTVPGPTAVCAPISMRPASGPHMHAGRQGHIVVQHQRAIRGSNKAASAQPHVVAQPHLPAARQGKPGAETHGTAAGEQPAPGQQPQGQPHGRGHPGKQGYPQLFHGRGQTLLCAGRASVAQPPPGTWTQSNRTEPVQTGRGRSRQDQIDQDQTGLGQSGQSRAAARTQPFICCTRA